VYAALVELKRKYGMDTYIDNTCSDYLSEMFTPETVELPVLSDVFCNYNAINFEPYNKHLKHLLSEEQYKKGRTIFFFPPKTLGGSEIMGGYK